MPLKILIVFLQDETERTVTADRWEVENGVLYTWRTGGYDGRYDRQFFPICNILRWAVLD